MALVTIKSRTDKWMAATAMAIMVGFASYGLYSSSFPIYWHAYATFIKPFHDPSFRTLGDDPFSSILQQQQDDQGAKQTEAKQHPDGQPSSKTTAAPGAAAKQASQPAADAREAAERRAAENKAREAAAAEAAKADEGLKAAAKAKAAEEAKAAADARKAEEAKAAEEEKAKAKAAEEEKAKAKAAEDAKAAEEAKAAADARAAAEARAAATAKAEADAKAARERAEADAVAKAAHAAHENAGAKSADGKAAGTTEPRQLVHADYELSRERVMQHAQDGYVMVTWANEHYLDFAISWMANIRRQGITGYLVGAMDDDMLKQLISRDINCWRMNTGISRNDLGWGSPLFHKMGRAKIHLILEFLNIAPEITVVVSDIDTAWLRNPFPFFSRYPEADILTSSDQLRPTVRTEDLERYPEAGAAFNIGIMMFRPNSKAFVAEWIRQLEMPNVWDQNAFNDISKRGSGHSDAKGVFPAFEGRLRMGVLPVSQFASGQVFFVQKKHEEFGLKPYVAHATFQYSGTPGKRHRMREFMLWEDPPSYFDHPKGFINLRVDIPHELLANASGQHLKYSLTATQTDSHFNLVNHQLLHIRAGVALAQLTGRVLIMPPIWCELDKYWSVLEYGSIPGSIFKRPFICPMDHVFEIENGWNPDKPYGFPPDQVGPKVEWREYSFLDNPKLPRSVRESRLRVEVCPNSKLEGCNDGTTPASAQGNSIHVRPGLNSDQILKALEAVSHHKILDFRHVDRLWPQYSQEGGWFTDPAAHQRFVKRIQFMTSCICCLNIHPRQPGWMWYDLQWDVPHTDRFGRKYDAWHLKVGDGGDIRPPRVRRRRNRQLLTRITEGEAGYPVQHVPTLQQRLQGLSPL